MGEAAPGRVSDFFQAECPDWLLDLGNGTRLGIEFTSLYHQEGRNQPGGGDPRLPLQQMEGIQDDICKMVEREWKSRKLPPCHISLLFSGNRFPKKSQKHKVVEALISEVTLSMAASNNTESTVSVDDVWDHPILGGLIQSISIFCDSSCAEVCISSPKAAFLPPLNNEAIRGVLKVKHDKINDYRMNCSRIWLVIVHGDAGLSTHFQRCRKDEELCGESLFDRVYILDALKGSVISWNCKAD
jgi:hypothetical protein